jgi:hypothetical protein
MKRKLLHFYFALISLPVAIFFPSGFPSIAESKIVGFSYPSAPDSEAESLICYMKTEKGSILNLGRLCRDSLRQQPQILVSEVALNDNQFSGRIVNRGSKAVSTIRVHYETLDDNQKIIQRSAVFAEPRTLEPGQSATFQNPAPNARALNILFIEGKTIPTN